MILLESAILPVNRIFQPVSKTSFIIAVFFLRLLINHDLPSRTACRRTGGCQTLKLIIIFWYRINHMALLSFQKRQHRCDAMLPLQSYTILFYHIPTDSQLPNLPQQPHQQQNHQRHCKDSCHSFYHNDQCNLNITHFFSSLILLASPSFHFYFSHL